MTNPQVLMKALAHSSLLYRASVVVRGPLAIVEVVRGPLVAVEVVRGPLAAVEVA